jgi:hypothetical protein
VTFVNGGDYDEAVQELVKYEAWNKGPDELRFCWRDRDGSLPAMLWTRHPQGTTSDMKNAWLEKAANLIQT